jgi:hypothetical protein
MNVFKGSGVADSEFWRFIEYSWAEICSKFVTIELGRLPKNASELRYRIGANIDGNIELCTLKSLEKNIFFIYAINIIEKYFDIIGNE